MELSYNVIKKLDVVCLNDGKNLGRVCDLVFLYPENRVKGFFVTGGKGFRFSRQEEFIPITSVTKIGEDVILVKREEKKEKCPPRHERNCCPPPFVRDGGDDRRDTGEYE